MTAISGCGENTPAVRRCSGRSRESRGRWAAEGDEGARGDHGVSLTSTRRAVVGPASGLASPCRAAPRQPCRLTRRSAARRSEPRRRVIRPRHERVRVVRRRPPHEVGRDRGWIVALIALAPLGAKLADVTSDDTASFLPPQAESTKVQAAAQGPLPRRRDEQRPDRLQARGRPDRRRQAARSPATRARVDKALPVTAALAGPVRAGRAVRARLAGRRHRLHGRHASARLQEARPTGARTRARSSATAAAACEVYVTGDLGLQADFEEVFGDFDTKLLLATVLLVLFLLGAIYRAPVIALIPLVVVVLRLPGRQRRSSTSTPTPATPSPRTRRASWSS